MRIWQLKAAAGLNAAAACGFLAWAASLSLQEPIPFESRPVTSWRPADDITMPLTYTEPSFQQMSSALDRPLFRKSRKPFVPGDIELPAAVEVVQSAPPPPAPPPDMSQLVLKGVLISETDKRALIATADSPDGVWLQPGATVAGWKVDKLEPGRAILALGSQTIELKLYVDKPAN